MSSTIPIVRIDFINHQFGHFWDYKENIYLEIRNIREWARWTKNRKKHSKRKMFIWQIYYFWVCQSTLNYFSCIATLEIEIGKDMRYCWVKLNPHRRLLCDLDHERGREILQILSLTRCLRIGKTLQNDIDRANSYKSQLPAPWSVSNFEP